MSALEVRVPDIGGFEDVPVIEVLVEAGERVGMDAPLVTLESDKATMEVPSPAAGVVEAIAIRVGDKVREGTPLLTLDPDDRGGEPPPPTLVGGPEGHPIARPEPPGDAAFRKPHASPAVRKYARELGVDLVPIAGSGPADRILVEDVQAFVKDALGGPGARRNQATLPRATHHDEADITGLEAFRARANREHEKTGMPIPMLAFVIKACAAALREFPAFSASFDGDSPAAKRGIHVGFAADTPDGLVVPVVRDADATGVLAIAAEVAELSARAREGRLQPADTQAGSFWISAPDIGGTHFPAGIDASAVATLGLSRARTVPVWDGERFVPRLLLPLSLSYDERVIGGAAAARFTSLLGALLADLRRAVL